MENMTRDWGKEGRVVTCDCDASPLASFTDSEMIHLQVGQTHPPP